MMNEYIRSKHVEQEKTVEWKLFIQTVHLVGQLHDTVESN